MKYWKKLTREQISKRVLNALKNNVDYRDRTVLGVPASRLDQKVFYDNSTLMADAPFLNTLLQNPNHIGCHTLGESEQFFSGTQKIEKELIGICSADILKGESGNFDGYVAAGGTEANIQALWIYRNYFLREKGADISEIAVLCSEDSHYSMSKGANLLNLPIYFAKVDFESRRILKNELEKTVKNAQNEDIRYFIVVANMMTTMFGSVDEPEIFKEVLDNVNLPFQLHVDGAFGGFVYPFSNPDHALDFRNPIVNSVTLDAHKMVEAPYGTGIFVIRKGWMKYALTEEAQYVKGLDATLSGSRSGANALAVWMILMTYGPNGRHEKIHILNHRAAWLCRQLDELDIKYFREPGSNIITIQSQFISKELAQMFGLVPDVHHGEADWYKIVIMEHVTVDELEKFTETLKTVKPLKHSKEILT